MSEFTTAKGDPVPGFEPRRPETEDELRYWLQNMVWDHRYALDEIEAATGMAPDEIEDALKRFDIRLDNRPARPANGPLHLVPWPGGRAVSDWGEPLEPTRRRETKATVFAPWSDEEYVVLDAPEAIFSQLGCIYLAHEDIETYWTERGVDLEKLEWTRLPGDVLEIERRMPNGWSFKSRFAPDRNAIRMRIDFTNGTGVALTGMRTQNCVFLKGMKGMQNDDEPRVVVDGAATAYGTHDGRRWVVTVWDPLNNCWNNPKNPCFHSDPRFPDCEPGGTSTIRGLLSFYQGEDVTAELARLKAMLDAGWE